MSIESDFSNSFVLNEVGYLKKKTKTGINNAFQNLGGKLVSTSYRLIEETKRAPWSYRVKIRGSYVTHHPSMPNHPAAEMTGKLKRSIGFINSGSRLEFGAGNNLDRNNTDSVHYARYVELGTSKMIKRPYLKPSITSNESEAYKDLKFQIKRELNK